MTATQYKSSSLSNLFTLLRAMEQLHQKTLENRARVAAAYEIAPVPQMMVRVPAKPKRAPPPEPESQKEHLEQMAERYPWYDV